MYMLCVFRKKCVDFFPRENCCLCPHANMGTIAVTVVFIFHHQFTDSVNQRATYIRVMQAILLTS